MSKITLQRNMDNGYGVVFCVQKQDFELNNIHEYFKDCLELDDNRFDIDKPFENIDSVVKFLDTNWDELVDTGIMVELDNSDTFDYYMSTCNPNEAGNSVDKLVLFYDGKILFES